MVDCSCIGSSSRRQICAWLVCFVFVPVCALCLSIYIYMCVCSVCCVCTLFVCLPDVVRVEVFEGPLQLDEPPGPIEGLAHRSEEQDPPVCT